MIHWGEALIKELAARRCIVFFGSGASAGCKSQNSASNPPTWEALLLALIKRMRADEAARTLANKLIAEKDYLNAAEVIIRGMPHADYVDEMRKIFEVPRYQHSKIHEAILEIDPKIVVTTNFDTVYDQYCRSGNANEGYNIFKYTDSHLAAQLRSPIRCIIKAHGCITDPDSMVLTKSGFFKAKQKAPHFFKLLDALFLVNTILFVGYSLNDPDIQLTLENINIATPSSHKHYFVTPSGTPTALREAQENAWNLEFLEFPTGDFGELATSLKNLAQRVLDFRQDNPNL